MRFSLIEINESLYCPFPGLNFAHVDPQELKIDFLLFLGAKALLVEKNYIKFQVYLMAIYDLKKLEESIFYLLPQNSDFACFNVTFVLNTDFKDKNVVSIDTER